MIPFKRGRTCLLCGQKHEAWQLIGGGYEANWFAALLREALPVAVCEVCFRTSFLKQKVVEPVGIAILPEVEARSVRWGEVEKYLLRAKKTYGIGPDFDVSGYLTHAEADDLLESRTLFRSIHISPVFGEVKTLFSFEEKPSDGLKVAHIGLTSFMLSCESTRWNCVRTLDDFEWLHNRLLSSRKAPYLPPLPDAQVPGSLAELLLEDFLCFACIHIASNDDALQAFLRPSYRVARAALDVELEQNWFLLRNRTRHSNPAVPPQRYIDHAVRMIKESQQKRTEVCGKLIQMVFDTGPIDTPSLSSAPTSLDDHVAIVRWQIQQSRQMSTWWKHLHATILEY